MSTSASRGMRPALGKKSLQEISDFLAGHGLRFGQELEQGDDGTLWWVIGETPGDGETTDENAGDGAGRELEP